MFPTLTFLTNVPAHFGIKRRHNWQHWLVGTLWSKSWKIPHCLLLCTFYWINKLFIIDALQRKRMHHYKTKYSKKITKAFMKINLWITIKDLICPTLPMKVAKKKVEFEKKILPWHLWVNFHPPLLELALHYGALVVVINKNTK